MAILTQPKKGRRRLKRKVSASRLPLKARKARSARLRRGKAAGLSRKLRRLKGYRRRRRRQSPAISIPAPAAQLPVLPAGINLVGNGRAESGLGESLRAAARALSRTDIPFGIVDIPESPSRSSDLSWVHREIPEPVYRVNVLHMNADYLKLFQQHNGHVFHNHLNIGVWHWELPDFPNEWCDSFQLVHEVWAPSRFIQNSVAAKSPVPVVYIPHAIEVQYPAELTREHFGLPEGRFLFLSMYDTFSFAQRKNPIAVIEAFKMAFSPDNPHVGLAVKVNNPTADIIPSIQHELDKLRAAIDGWPNIYLINQIMDRPVVNALISLCNSYVSLHRSEGFGLPMAEAMFLGKPTIATYYSANIDYMDSDNSCPVPFRLVPVGEDYGPYKAYQTWADPDLAHAAHYMKRLVEDHHYYQQISVQGAHTIYTRFSPTAIGALIRQRIRELGVM
ncbi:glycosyltransferase [Paenibacillus senegalensis]|uniref:glycosyltransferase n=1 Tax=Paenibacillus senegalensis TaxID=1465766 RepID=UPI000289AA30|nr:glycosyltransferase [Paenibacillus senegalensis]